MTKIRKTVVYVVIMHQKNVKLPKRAFLQSLVSSLYWKPECPYLLWISWKPINILQDFWYICEFCGFYVLVYTPNDVIKPLKLSKIVLEHFFCNTTMLSKWKMRGKIKIKKIEEKNYNRRYLVGIMTSSQAKKPYIL